MMEKSQRENKIIFICWLAYAVAYVGRLNFAASIVAIVSDMGVSKSSAGLVSSCFFFAYGIGQLVNGVLSKRYNGRAMVFISLFISGCLNFIMPICNNISIMKYIWLVNGAVQSILWCTLIQTISQKVSDEKMSKAIIVMSTPTAIGTIAAYGLSALFVQISNWKITFFVAGVLLIITAVIWFVLYGNDKLSNFANSNENLENNKIPKSIIFCIATMALACVANGFVKDGVTTWGASVMYEKFGISQSFSILLTLLMPMAGVVGATFVVKIHKKIESHSKMNLIFYAVTLFMCSGLLIALKMHSLALLLISFTAVACLMSMVNNVVTSVFPLDRRKVLGSGFISGLLNAFCYVGSTTASYSLGAVAQNDGWKAVFILLIAVSAFGIIISIFGTKAERKFKL